MNDLEHKRLVWQCRRGTKELDAMMTYYLRCHYSHAEARHQEAFRELLELPDPALYRRIMSGSLEASDLAQSQVANVIFAGFHGSVREGDE